MGRSAMNPQPGINRLINTGERPDARTTDTRAGSETKRAGSPVFILPSSTFQDTNIVYQGEPRFPPIYLGSFLVE